MLREIVLTFLCCFYGFILVSQENSNPFEIRAIHVQDSVVSQNRFSFDFIAESF